MIRSVIIIGSGPIVIGQAAEFDYSGTQACLACREAGVRSILVNSNPATIQTDPHIADKVYIEPLTVHSLVQVIERERPDGLIGTVGGQTGLNLAVGLAEEGVLERYGVKVLGTGLDAIRRGEDRALFAATLRGIGQPILPSEAVTSVDAALEVAEGLGYPVMCRSAFALGGAGSGFAGDPAGLIYQVTAGLRSSGSGQVLVEKSVYGWAEIEYEVVRDGQDNCLVVCNMENLDPMGVHTGDSIVVAPSQTLSDDEYHQLRAAAIQIVRALGVEGACNVQFALNRETGEYYVIEVNPRLSRSSALASKATGYPIAKVATHIALGKSLPELRNDITGTSAFFEPSLDYVTVKIPRWPFDKLTSVNPVIGTSMRSTGEVMAIGRTFEEAMRKALRSLDQGTYHLHAPGDLEAQLAEPNGKRLPAVLQALRFGWEPRQVAGLTGINPWFVDRLVAVAEGVEATETVYKMVDTCSAEFEARTPYFYGSDLPGGHNEAQSLPGLKAIILGAGPIRIGQGIEFDYATVHACHALSEAGVRSIIVNNNPETVSTDYSTSDRLYFEPLDVDAVMAVVRNEAEGLLGIIPQFGGQTAINLVAPLRERGVRILGTQPEAIDAAEDRGQTSAVLAAHGIPAPRWQAINRWEDLPAAVAEAGFPVLLRPSYVLAGRGMIVVHTQDELDRYLETHGGEQLDKPLLIDHFLEGAVELNVDAVSDGTDVVTVIMEQLDECGIHSGDSAEVYPVQTIEPQILNTVEEYTRRLARAFGIVGLMNVQYAVHEGRVYVLEVNPRASRSVPFASKASGIPLADLAVRIILGQESSSLAGLFSPVSIPGRLHDLSNGGAVSAPVTGRVCVKGVVFPFRTFPTLAPILGPEMQSTGESMGVGPTFAAAYWKAWFGAGLQQLPFGRSVYLSAGDVAIRGEAGVAGALREDPAREPHHPVSTGMTDLIQALNHVGCSVLVPPGSSEMAGTVPCPAGEVNIMELGLVIALNQSEEELTLLRRAIDARIPFITTQGGVRALLLALQESDPCLDIAAGW